MKRFLACSVLVGVLIKPAFAVVLDFEDLAPAQFLSGTTYQGIAWEYGVAGWEGNRGFWAVPDKWNYPVGNRNLINAWGSTSIGMSFSSPVDVIGAFISAQGATPRYWTTGVRVHAYRSQAKVRTTNWFTNIESIPQWFAMGLTDVDRVVFETVPVVDGEGGWFGLDNFTFVVPEPNAVTLGLLGGVLCLRRTRSSRRSPHSPTPPPSPPSSRWCWPSPETYDGSGRDRRRRQQDRPLHPMAAGPVE